MSCVVKDEAFDERQPPLVIAAYKDKEPSRKKRVKVPPNLEWNQFLDLFYDRFEISRDVAVEIYDENGIEIVSTQDLLQGDVLVVKEIVRAGISRREHLERPPESNAPTLASAPTMSVEHFIQATSLGYYFVGKGSTIIRVNGKQRQVHCIIKVPRPGLQQPLRSEAHLLESIAGHKSIVAPPSTSVFDTRSPDAQQLYRKLTDDRRKLLYELFSFERSATAYIYPLYGVTMATKIKVQVGHTGRFHKDMILPFDCEGEKPMF